MGLGIKDVHFCWKCKQKNGLGILVSICTFLPCINYSENQIRDIRSQETFNEIFTVDPLCSFGVEEFVFMLD